MVVKLPYGRGSVVCDVRGLSVADLRPRLPKVLPPAEQLVAQAFRNPFGQTLAQRSQGRAGAVILVPDTTRKAALPLVLPALFQELAQGGIRPQEVTLLVACGTHPPAEEAALQQHLGILPFGVRVVQHRAKDRESLVFVGNLTDGTPVRLHRLAVEAPLLVSVFSVQHHYFAGFGGGPKMVFPGVAGYEEIQRNHSRVIDLTCDPPRLHPRCQAGVLEGNPVFQEIAQVAKLRPVDWAVGCVLAESGQPAWMGAGSPHEVWQQAVQRVRAWFEVESGPFSKVVVSAGGYPSDATLIQAHKAAEAASRFLVEGGEMLLMADLSHGAGAAAMEPFLADPDPMRIAQELRREYVQYGHTTWRIVDKTRRFRIFLYSTLARSVAERLGFIPVGHPQEVVDRWRSEREAQTVAVMSRGLVYPRAPAAQEAG